MSTIQRLMGAGLAPLQAGAILGGAANFLTSTGVGQSDAFFINATVSVFTTVPAGTGCILHTPNIGDEFHIVNNGANSLSVYPPVGGVVANLATNAAYTLPPGCTVRFKAISNTAYFFQGGVIDGSGNIAANSLAITGVEDTLTAFAGGGQTNATQLSTTKTIHRVTTVATAADSIKLPAGTAGLMHFVMNSAAANALQVFGQTGEKINDVASATGVSVGSGKSAWFVCISTGNWYMNLSA